MALVNHKHVLSPPGGMETDVDDTEGRTKLLNVLSPLGGMVTVLKDYILTFPSPNYVPSPLGGMVTSFSFRLSFRLCQF